MPARKTNRRKPAKKRQARKTNRRVGRPSYNGAFPPRAFAKLKYSSDNIGANSSTGVYVHQFRLNSLFDPDYTSTGHQPMGFDQYAALYNDYRVHGCKVRVTVSLASAGETGLFFIGAKGGTGYPDTATTTDWLEDSQYKHYVLKDEKPIVVDRYFDIARVFGKSKKAIGGEDGYSAGVGASPLNGAIMTLGWINTDDTTLTSWKIRLDMVFYCEFNDLAVLGGS